MGRIPQPLKYPKTAQIRMELDEWEKVDQVRETLDLSRSMMVRRAIREYLERNFSAQTKSAERGTNSQGA